MTNRRNSYVLAITVVGILSLGMNGCDKNNQNPTVKTANSKALMSAELASNENLTHHINFALSGIKSLGMTDISVATDKGIVSLNGFVENQSQHQQAITAIRNLEGVNTINDNLIIIDLDQN